MADPVTEVTVEAPVPGRFKRVIGRLFRLAAVFAGLLGVGLTAAAIALVYPYVRDDLAIDGIVRSVALDWRDFGRAKADERLRYEFAAQSIGRHTSPADCMLEETPRGREVACRWSVHLRFGSEIHLPLAFSSEARVLPNGDLE